MAAKRFWLIITSLFSFLFILGIFSGGECQVVSWRALREKDNLNLQLKMASCYLENGEFKRAEKKLEEVKDMAGSDNLFLAEELKAYESRLRSVNPKTRKQEILFWKQKVVANPSYPDAWVSLGLLWQQEGKEKMARLALSKGCGLGGGRGDIEKVTNQLGDYCQ